MTRHNGHIAYVRAISAVRECAPYCNEAAMFTNEAADSTIYEDGFQILRVFLAKWRCMVKRFKFVPVDAFDIVRPGESQSVSM